MRFSVLFVALLAGACADFHRGPVGDAALVDDPVFEQDVYPVLLDKCQACHSPGNQAQATRFVLTGNDKPDRAMLVDLVSPGRPADSLLLKRALGEEHEGGQRITVDSPEYTTIAGWITRLKSAH
jgi:hypothetical protein